MSPSNGRDRPDITNCRSATIIRSGDITRCSLSCLLGAERQSTLAIELEQAYGVYTGLECTPCSSLFDSRRSYSWLMISCGEYTPIASHLINLTSRIGTTIQSLLEDFSTSHDVSALPTSKSHMVTTKITLHLPVCNIILCRLKSPGLLKVESKLCTRSIN